MIFLSEIQNGEEEEGARWTATTEWRRAKEEIIYMSYFRTKVLKLTLFYFIISYENMFSIFWRKR